MTIIQKPPGAVVTFRSGSMLAGPSHTRSQTSCSQASASEYVEDSEPEREQRRIKKRSSDKQQHADFRVQSSQDVIELTDSDSSDHDDDAQPPIPMVSARGKPLIVIEISGVFVGAANSAESSLLTVCNR